MNVKANAVQFLEALGFSDVRPIQGDGVRMLVRDALKVVRKCLKSKDMKFSLIEEVSTSGSRKETYFVIQDRKVLGRLRVEAFTTHSIIELENCQ